MREMSWVRAGRLRRFTSFLLRYGEADLPAALRRARRELELSPATASRYLADLVREGPQSSVWERPGTQGVARVLELARVYREKADPPAACGGCGRRVMMLPAECWQVLRDAMEVAAGVRGRPLPVWPDRLNEGLEGRLPNAWDALWEADRYSLATIPLVGKGVPNAETILEELRKLVPPELEADPAAPRVLPDDGEELLELLLAEVGWVTPPSSTAPSTRLDRVSVPDPLRVRDEVERYRRERTAAEGVTVRHFEEELEAAYRRVLPPLRRTLGRTAVEARDERAERGVAYWMRLERGELEVVVATRRRVVGRARGLVEGARGPDGCWHRLDHHARLEASDAVEMPLWPGGLGLRIERRPGRQVLRPLLA